MTAFKLQKRFHSSISNLLWMTIYNLYLKIYFAGFVENGQKFLFAQMYISHQNYLKYFDKSKYQIEILLLRNVM